MNEKIEALLERRKQLVNDLEDNFTALKFATLETAEFKVGDEVVIVTPAEPARRFLFDSAAKAIPARPERRRKAKVVSVDFRLRGISRDPEIDYGLVGTVKSGAYGKRAETVHYGEHLERP